MPLDDVATILGWELKRVKELARRYVTGEAIGLGMIARLQGDLEQTTNCKTLCKTHPSRRGSNALKSLWENGWGTRTRT